MFANPATMTPQEVLATDVGDYVRSGGDWYVIREITERGTSANHDPIVHFTADMPSAPWVKWHGYVYPGRVRSAYRKRAAVLAAE